MRLLLPAASLAGLLGLLLTSACGGSGGQHTASIIHRLLVASSSSDTSQLESFTGRLPDGLRPAAAELARPGERC